MATILRSRVAWAKPREQAETRTSSDLTPTEQANVKAALHFLAKRFGTFRALAEAMGSKRKTVMYAAMKKAGVSAGIALRAARAAGVPLEDLLSGAWPSAGACPHCGRC
jgi:hypothetical protein